MRGVAAVAVLLLHTREHLFPGLARSAYLAVDFFFVLSGFVVAHAYDAKLGAQPGTGSGAGPGVRPGLSVVEFLKLRVVRLYPLYLAGLLLGAAFLTAAALAGGGPLSLGEIGLSLALGALFLPSPFNGRDWGLFPLDGPAWSLFFEMLANIAYGVTHRWLSTRVLVATVLVSGAALCVQAAVAGTVDSGAGWNNIHGGFARVFFSFPLGVLLCRWRASIPAGLGRLGPWPLMAALFLLCLPTVPAPWRAVYDLAFVFALAPALVAAGAQVAPSPAARPFFAALGVISFPLYALHAPLEGPIVAAAEGLGLGRPAAGLAYLAAILAVAWLAAPLDSAVRRRLLGRARRPQGQAS